MKSMNPLSRSHLIPSLFGITILAPLLCACGTAEGTFDDTKGCEEPPVCPPNTYLADSSSCNTSTCTPWINCVAGEYVVSEGTASTDRECSPCEDGTFSPQANQEACLAHQECEFGSTQISSGSPTGDAICEACPDGYWDHDERQETACIPTTECPPGWSIIEAGGGDRDRSCSPCTLGNFTPSNNTEDCSPWTVCAPGERVSKLPSYFSDRECSPCEDSFSEVENAPECVPWVACQAGRRIDTPGTPTSDQTCISWQWANQLGTDSSDYVAALQITSNGDFYIAGSTYGEWAHNTSSGQRDAFVGKLTHQGEIAWLRQFGSSKDDLATDVAIDNEENLIVVGYSNAPLAGQVGKGSTDAFIRKYDQLGNELWTRVIGTAAGDYAFSVTTDGDGDIYIAGTTFGSLPGQTSSGHFDIFANKFTGDGDEEWVLQIGTSTEDQGRGIAVDAAGNSYVAGFSNGTFPDQTYVGGVDAVLVKLTPSGELAWLDQYGTPESDSGDYVAVSGSQIYVAGSTLGLIDGDVQHGLRDVFISQYANTGEHGWIRQAGTEDEDTISGLSISRTGTPLLAGSTNGELIGWQTSGTTDAFMLEFDATGSQLFGRQFGTPQNDAAAALVMSSGGELYAAGNTTGEFIPDGSSGLFDIFIAELVE